MKTLSQCVRSRALLLAVPLFLALCLSWGTPARGEDFHPLEPVVVLETFLKNLAEGRIDEAYSLVAPSSREKGDPIAYHAKLDREAFGRELGVAPGDIGGVPNAKFARYEMGTQRWETMHLLRVWIDFGGDRDEAMIVHEAGRWYVADPIHIIR